MIDSAGKTYHFELNVPFGKTSSLELTETDFLYAPDFEFTQQT